MINTSPEIYFFCLARAFRAPKPQSAPITLAVMERECLHWMNALTGLAA